MKGIRMQGGIPLQGRYAYRDQKCGTSDPGGNASYQ